MRRLRIGDLPPPHQLRSVRVRVHRRTPPADPGTLWTFTTQEFLPKEPYAGGETPETFVPYGVGLIQLEDIVQVEGRLTEADPANLRIGMEMELVVIPFRSDPDGTETMTFAFAPVDQES